MSSSERDLSGPEPFDDGPLRPPQLSPDEILDTLRARNQSRRAEAAQPFRPFHRPPMALLCIHDDGMDGGETVRVRADRLVIGRSEGDVQIPHDAMMSARHAELVRWLDQGRWRWRLIDLQSTNGTYVRLNTIVLKHNQEVLIGSHRFRFFAAPQGCDAAEAEGHLPPGTRSWTSVSAQAVEPALIELTAEGQGQRYPITQPDVWLGRDPQHCQIVITDDPLVSPRHARLVRNSKERWQLTNAQARNGLWLRIDEVAIDTACQFQLGEQRFTLKVL